jgi:glucose-6-phosphate-specific signal transduction histidine kinase
MTHAYWWRCNTVMWYRNISQILLHSEQLCEILEWPVTVQFPLVSDCRVTVWVSVVNNKMCVVVMLSIQVMYIIFQLYSKTLKITSVNNYSDELKFWDKQFN